MLKLLKYELIHSWRTFGLVYLAFLLMCIVIPFTNPTYNSNFIANFLVFALVMLTMGISISIVVSIAMTFNKSMFKRPGYLTLTLPVSTHQILISKLIADIIWIFASCFILFFGFILMAMLISVTSPYFTINWNDIFSIFSRIHITWSDLFELFSLLILGICSSVMSLSLIYLSITIAYTKFITRFRTGISLLFFFIVNYFYSSIHNLIYGLFTHSTYPSFLTEIYLNIGIVIIFAAVYYFATYYILEHKLEIE